MKRVIICGFGFMGQNHAGCVFQCPDLELAAVVDATPKSRIMPVKGNVSTGELDWEKLRDIPFFSSLSEALDRCEADAVLIAAPTRFHVPLALEAVSRGKHVFVEKPICFDLDEAAELGNALLGKNLVFQVGHCIRFKSEYSFLRSCLEEKRYGGLRYLKLCRLTGKPDWGAWKQLDSSLTSPSGPLFDLNIHDIDYALSLLGEPEQAVIHAADYSDSVFRTEWQYRGGSRVEIEGGFPLPSSLPFRAGFTAFFEHAVLEYDSRFGDKIVLSDERESRIADCEMKQSIYQAEIMEFASSMIHGTPVQCGLEDGIRAVAWCHRLKDMLIEK